MPAIMGTKKHSGLKKRFIHNRQNTHTQKYKMSRNNFKRNVWEQMENTTETCYNVQKAV